MGKEDLEKPRKVKLRVYPTLHTHTHTHTHTYTKQNTQHTHIHTENLAQDVDIPIFRHFSCIFSH